MPPKVKEDDADEDRIDPKALVGEILAGLKTQLPTGAPITAEAINQAMFHDNFRLREDKRTLKAQLAEANKATEGAVILTGDEVALYDGYTALGLTPAQINEVLAGYDDLQTESTATRAATALGWKVAVLKDQIASKGLDIEFQDVDVNGAKVGMPFVVHEDAKGKALTTRLDEYEPLKDYHGALVVEEGNAGGRSPAGLRVPAQGPSTGRPGPSTSQGKAQAASQVVANTVSSRYRGNPLVKSLKGDDTKK